MGVRMMSVFTCCCGTGSVRLIAQKPARRQGANLKMGGKCPLNGWIGDTIQTDRRCVKVLKDTTSTRRKRTPDGVQRQGERRRGRIKSVW
eukprot:2823289-Prymnesium_polylepis.1